jgi:hypothetical protein
MDMTIHVPTCKNKWRGHDATVKRITDMVNQRWHDNGWDGYVNHWMSFRLSDGVSNGDLYPTKRDAVKHVDNELRYLFLKMHPGGINECECDIMLTFTRDAVTNGFRLADPDAKDGGRDIIPHIATEQVHSQLRQMKHAN